MRAQPVSNVSLCGQCGMCFRTYAFFSRAINDYPAIRIASGGDFRFDASRDGCTNEVKRGNTPQHNFLASFNVSPFPY